MGILKVYPGFEIEDDINPISIMRKLERAARLCYKSEDKITYESYKAKVQNIIDRGHESVVEHTSITVRIICDRGVTHELVRHRIASYSQESTRYCNYMGGLAVIVPGFWDPDSPIFRNFENVEKCMVVWQRAMEQDAENYDELISLGATPQEARTVLANSLKTEIMVTMNLREWRHFFKLRTAPAAHPQMREIAIPILESFSKMLPIIFDDLN